MDTAKITTTAAPCTTGVASSEAPGVALRIPNYSAMAMGELRLYFQTLRMLVDTFNGQQSRPLANGAGSEVSAWLDEAFAAVDTLTVDLMQYLQNARLQGADERFRLCMLIEHEAWLGESMDDIAKIIRTALLPIPAGVK